MNIIKLIFYFKEVYFMKKSKKILAVMMAVIMMLSVTVVGASMTPVSAAEETEISEPLGASNFTLYVGQTDYYYGHYDFD